MSRSRVIAAAAVLAAALTACGSGDGLTVEGVWARPSPMMADAGAVYMQITSEGDDRLIGATVDPTVAGTAEIHETVVAEMDGGDDVEGGMGAMMMMEVGAIDLPAGETVALEPGGYHIMLLGLPEPLVAGATFEIVLRFEQAGEQIFEVPVRDQAP